MLQQTAKQLPVFLDRSKRLYQLLMEENDLRTTFEISAHERLRAYTNGFTSRSAVLYDLTGNQGAYLPDFNRYVLSPETNGKWSSFFDDKLSFYHLLNEHDKHRVPVYAAFRNGRVHSIEAADCDEVTTGAWLCDALKREGRIVVKPITGGGGEGVQICSYSNGVYRINGNRLTKAEFTAEMDGLDRSIACEFVDQAEYSHKLFSETPNTIRVLTMIDPTTGEAFIARAIQRIGSERSGSVDNFSSGGLSALINPITGTLGPGVQYPHPDQVDTITAEDLEWHETHPDIAEPISGVQIPAWATISKRLLAIAEDLSYIPYAGWDIIVTDNEGSFKLIEANSHTGVKAMQVHAPLLEDERVRRFYEYYGII